MSGIEVAVSIPAGPEQVWDEISDVASHVSWMADAEEIRFLSAQTSGAGTKFECLTRVGPLHTKDRMVITEWVPGAAMAVEHAGLFKGAGRFTLKPTSEGGTRFVWTENLQFPWYFAGPLGAFVARPVLTAIWKGNLRRLRDRVIEQVSTDKGAGE